MEIWERLRYLEVGWGGLSLLALAFFAALMLRRVLPEARRDRGRLTLLLLGTAPLLHLLATGLRLVGAPGASAAAHLVNITLVVFGVTGLGGLLVFDVALGRTRLPTVVRDFTLATAVVSIVVIILRSGGVDALSALATSAVAAAIIGFALQGIIANVFAGMILQLDRTLRLGDVVQWGQRTGTIEQVGWRSSQILTREGDAAIVPNAVLLTNEVLNLSRPTRRHRTSVTVPFERRHAPDEVRRALLPVFDEIAGIARDPAPICGVAEFNLGDHPHVVYILIFWIEDALHEGRMQGEVRERAWHAAARAGLEGPWEGGSCEGAPPTGG